MSSVKHPPNLSKRRQAPVPIRALLRAPTKEGGPSGTGPSAAVLGCRGQEAGRACQCGAVPLGGRAQVESTADCGGARPGSRKTPCSSENTQRRECDNEVLFLMSLAGTSLKAAVTARWGHSPGWQGLARTQPQPKAQNPHCPPLQMTGPDTSPSHSAAPWPPRVLW